jgi:cell volume regulation protein A
MGLPNAEAYPQIIFFVIITSVIITTIGLGGAKKIPAPESEGGGFVKKENEKEK